MINFNNRTIWVITVGFINALNQFRATRTPAFYFDKEDAIKTLYTNNADIYEDAYDVAVLEQIQEGCYGSTGIKEWFRYDKEKDGYFEIQEPESEKHYSGYGIG